MKETKTIIYFKHGLGNLVMLSPAIRALASMDASGQVDICLSSEWNDSRRSSYDDYFDKWDIVQNVINYPKEDFSKKYKIWFYTGHSEHSEALNIFLKKSRLQIEAPEWKERKIHEVFWYMEQVYKLGYTGHVPNQYVPLAKKPVLKNGKLTIGICNGTYSMKMTASKKWPYFNELVYTLKNYCDAKIIKVGYQNELEDVKTDINYVDKLTFTETAKVISQLDLFITTDTANMHVGDALQIPMVVLFGGTLISKNGALSKKAVNLTLGLSCQPCQKTNKFYNCDHYNCINKLTVGDVMTKVKEVLNGKNC